ncbi:GNAT family N-acetyltransferase [Spirillospora sp. NPDC052269]
MASSGARRLDLGDPAVLRRVWEIRRAAYAVEADVIGFDGIPALHESLDDLRRCGEEFLGAEDGDDLVAAISWTVLEDGTVQICRLVVHPSAHRRGLASTRGLTQATVLWSSSLVFGTALPPAPP